MSYITQSNLEAHYGAINVALWSNLDNNDETPDTDRISAAIEFAEAYIDDRFRGSKFSVPLSGESSALALIRHAAVMIAIAWLRRARETDAEGEDISALIPDEATNIIDAYLAGKMRLDAALAISPSPTVPYVTGQSAAGVCCGC